MNVSIRWKALVLWSTFVFTTSSVENSDAIATK